MSETTFKQAWSVLQKHAQALRNQTEPNIDDLLNIVTESVQAYKVCQSRVEAVEKALEEALKGSGTERPAEPPPLKSPVKTTAMPVDDGDDDVPF
jgi:exodeoxyribonuclease VII small subunit